MTDCALASPAGGLMAIFFSAAAAGQTATATLAPTAGNAVSGAGSFKQHGGKVTVSAKLSGLAPGGHFNPTGSVIVHKDVDDFKTQPTGKSGARAACGIIAKS